LAFSKVPQNLNNRQAEVEIGNPAGIAHNKSQSTAHG
jgi:hypothetical protein